MIRVIFFVFSAGMVLTRSIEPYYVSLGSSVWGYFTPPILKRPQQFQTPMEAMVDLTNSLGVVILEDHSYSRGNFAFSPYGVASVLVVMYEGARGESANQIHRAVGFPSNKDVLRTGFRDIHRHLRSYFSHEGFLSGISLNKNGSSLKPEYKKILKFYGYDVDLNTQLDDDQDTKPSIQRVEPTKVAVTISVQPNNETLSTTTKVPNEEMNSKNKTTDAPAEKLEDSSSTEKVSTEDGSDVLTTTLRNTVKETFPTTIEINVVGDSESNATTANSLEEEELLTTVERMSGEDRTTAQTTTVTSDTTTETEEVEKRMDSVTEVSGYEKMRQATGVFPEDIIVNTPEMLEPDDSNENKFHKNLEADEKREKCEADADASTGIQDKEILCKEEKKEGSKSERTEHTVKVLENKTEFNGMKLDNGMLIPQPGKDPEKADFEETTSEPGFLQSTTNAVDANGSKEATYKEESASQKSSEALHKMRRTLKPNNDSWEEHLRLMFNSKSSAWVYDPPKKRKRTHVERHKRTIADYLKWPLNQDLSLQLQNGMYDTHVSRNAEMYRSLPRIMFLVDGAIDTPVPMMTYTNVFPYCYVPKLHAKALEFPLDDIRYKLLIVLPVERRGLRQLIYDLADFSVRDVLKCLQPTRVKAMIPTFMVEGFVILTSSLQKLGIWDVFDPRKANLSGMSVDPELYVRNIEQSVTVVIRNYVEILDIQTRTMAARYLEHEFQATHPFVYFVLDTATNIALMAGQMLDPLNSRIY